MATSRGSSVHFRPLHSPMLCEAHDCRAVNPQYLLPEKDREPNLVIRDGDVAKVYAQKMALASGRARATPKYSPLKEGIVNLAEPPEVLHAKMARWCQEYEAITGERVDDLRHPPGWGAHLQRWHRATQCSCSRRGGSNG